MGTSYETSWAADRSPPSSEYLLFDAQPPRMIPYTPIEVIASRKSSPMFTSVTHSGVRTLPIRISGPKGMTARAVSAGITARTGARKCTAFSAREGVMSSLVTSFRRSATPWSRPLGPTRLGPSRACMNPMMRRSASTMTNPTIAGTSATRRTTFT